MSSIRTCKNMAVLSLSTMSIVTHCFFKNSEEKYYKVLLWYLCAAADSLGLQAKAGSVLQKVFNLLMLL